MTHNKFENLIEVVPNDAEEYNNPLDISDILNICQEYNKLGLTLQVQIENLIEVGVEEAIKSGAVRKNSLPFIKDFLHRICECVYFGDAVAQAQDCIALIKEYEDKNKINYISQYN